MTKLFMYQCRPALRRFLATARFVAELRGTIEDAWGRACVETGVDAFIHRHEYRDAIVHIEASRETPAIFIEMLTPHTNPVVSVYADGRVIRAHGEWIMIDAYVRACA